MWILYWTRDGYVIGESVNQYQNIRLEQAQIENPTDNRTPGLGTYVYDGSQVRDATAQEIADYQTNRDLDNTARDIRLMKESIDTQTDQLGRVLRAFAVLVLDEFNRHSAVIDTMLDSADGNATQFLSGLQGITNLGSRTKTQLLTGLKNNIDNQE